MPTGPGLGETVRRRREQLGLGQEQLAAALGVRQQTVSRWERDLAVPRPGRVVELARLLGMEPSVLHALAGYLPAAEPSPAAGRLALSRLSDAELVLLIEQAREELRSRAGDSPELPQQEEAAAG